MSERYTSNGAKYYLAMRTVLSILSTLVILVKETVGGGVKAAPIPAQGPRRPK